jgi:hypothetical protein
MGILAAIAGIAFTFACASPANAVDFSWKCETAAKQKTIDGFRLYDGNHKMVLDKIPAKACKTSVKEPTGCMSYYLVAYKGKVQSKPSHIVPYCPATIVITPIGGFAVIQKAK